MSDNAAAAALLAEVGRREADLARLDEQFRTATVTARAPDRLVAVTVDVRGHLVDVELASGAHRAYPEQRLGATIVELASRATQTLREHYENRIALSRIEE